MTAFEPHHDEFVQLTPVGVRTFVRHTHMDGDTVYIGTDKYTRGYLIRQLEDRDGWWVCTPLFGNRDFIYGESDDPEEAFSLASDFLEEVQ